MGIQIQGASGVIAEVSSIHKAKRMVDRPDDTLSWNSIGAKSGALTGAGAATPVFALRNIGANLILVRRVGVGFVTTTAFTAAQLLDWGLIVARAWTASDTGGTAVAFTGNNIKHRVTLANPTNADMRISAAAALTAGTRTLDANYLGMIAAYSSAVGLTLPPALANLFAHDISDHPLILAQNEGIEIHNLTAMGAAGVGNLYVNAEFAEIAAY